MSWLLWLLYGVPTLSYKSLFFIINLAKKKLFEPFCGGMTFPSFLMTNKIVPRVISILLLSFESMTKNKSLVLVE